MRHDVNDVVCFAILDASKIIQADCCKNVHEIV